MKQEWVYQWLVNLMGACLWLIAVTASIVVLGVSAGAYTEYQATKNARCINSACDEQCKPGARFVRHQGCEVKK